MAQVHLVLAAYTAVHQPSFLIMAVIHRINQIYAIKTTNAALFTTKSLYLFLSSDNAANPSAAGGITFRGKIEGNVVFTYIKTTGFNNSYSLNNGFTYVDFASAGFATTNIDESEMQTSSITNYMALDNFTWGTATPLPVSIISIAGWKNIHPAKPPKICCCHKLSLLSNFAPD